MRVQITFLLLFFSASVQAVDDKEMNELFKKYDLLMDEKKVELVDQVFTEKFLRESGGKKEFIEKVKEMETDKSASPSKVTWKKGVRDQMFFAKITPATKKKEVESAEFIVIEEKGKLKIDGQVGDGD